MSIAVIKLSESEPVSMSQHWFQIANDEHFWIQWRFKALLSLMEDKINQQEPSFEIGCGSGVFINQFESHFNQKIDGCDLDLIALEQAKKVKGNIYLYNIFDQHPTLTGKYKNIFLLDVLEHVENPVSFIDAVKPHAIVNGYIIINVPAQQWLYSKYDKAVGHKKRYNKASLKSVLESANMEVVEMRYWALSLLPILMLRSFILSLQKVDEKKIIYNGFKPPGKWSNFLFKCIMKIELFIFSKPFSGASLMAIAKIRS